jgi:hypothetical protein
MMLELNDVMSTFFMKYRFSSGVPNLGSNILIQQ